MTGLGMAEWVGVAQVLHFQREAMQEHLDHP